MSNGLRFLEAVWLQTMYNFYCNQSKSIKNMRFGQTICSIFYNDIWSAQYASHNIEMSWYYANIKEIYNPWSVINYISKGCLPQAYWVNTGNNEVLEDVLKTASIDIADKLYALLRGEPVIWRHQRRNCRMMARGCVKCPSRTGKLRWFIKKRFCHIWCRSERLQGLLRIK